MKNGPLFFLGLLVAIVLSWASLVLGTHAQIGSLTPYFDEGDSQSYPLRASGIAARGQLVYADLGCAACHSQQVSQPGFGSDKERGWGDRQNVARDYIFQARPQLGTSRIGRDLANFGGAKAPAEVDEITALLYSGKMIDPTNKSLHPTYKFLFETREITGQTAATALKFKGDLAPAAGFQVVPTERAQTLVAYLQNLNSAYVYPEAKPFVPKAKAGAAKKEEAKK